MLFGGGTIFTTVRQKAIARLEADCTITQLADVPFTWGSNSAGKVFGDDRIFALDVNSNTFVEYDVAGDSWAAGSLTQPTFTQLSGGNNWGPVCMIPEHGILYMIVKGSAGASKLQEWIYKL